MDTGACTHVHPRTMTKATVRKVSEASGNVVVAGVQVRALGVKVGDEVLVAETPEIIVIVPMPPDPPTPLEPECTRGPRQERLDRVLAALERGAASGRWGRRRGGR